MMPTPPVTTRKRNRAHQYTVSYSEVQEVDSNGQLREVIVIEDTPPPPTGAYSASYQPPVYSAPIAAEDQALSSTGTLAPAPKKRKRDLDEVRAQPAKKSDRTAQQQSLQTKSSWNSASAATDDVRALPIHNQKITYPHTITQTSKGPVSCDDKEGHYIIVPDDMIVKRCTYLSPLTCIRT